MQDLVRAQPPLARRQPVVVGAAGGRSVRPVERHVLAGLEVPRAEVGLQLPGPRGGRGPPTPASSRALKASSSAKTPPATSTVPSRRASSRRTRSWRPSGGRRGRRRLEPVFSWIPAAAASSSIERSRSAATSLEVGHRVVVAEQPEAEPAVVGHDRDPERGVERQRDLRVERAQPAALQVERELRPGHVRHDEVEEALAGLQPRRPGRAPSAPRTRSAASAPRRRPPGRTPSARPSPRG